MGSEEGKKLNLEDECHQNVSAIAPRPKILHQFPTTCPPGSHEVMNKLCLCPWLEDNGWSLLSPSPVSQAGTLDSWRACAWEASIPAGRKMRPAEFGMLLHAPELGSRAAGAGRLCVLSGVEFGRPHPSPAYSFTHSLNTGLVPAAGTPDTTEPRAQKPSGTPTTHWAWHSGLPVEHSRSPHLLVLLTLLVLGLCSRSQERPSGSSPLSTLCPFSQAQFQALFQEAWHHPPGWASLLTTRHLVRSGPCVCLPFGLSWMPPASLVTQHRPGRHSS